MFIPGRRAEELYYWRCCSALTALVSDHMLTFGREDLKVLQIGMQGPSLIIIALLHFDSLALPSASQGPPIPQVI